MEAKNDTTLFNETWTDTFNTLNRIQGWCDSPLTEKGREQARQVRAYLKSMI